MRTWSARIRSASSPAKLGAVWLSVVHFKTAVLMLAMTHSRPVWRCVKDDLEAATRKEAAASTLCTLVHAIRGFRNLEPQLLMSSERAGALRGGLRVRSRYERRGNNQGGTESND